MSKLIDVIRIELKLLFRNKIVWIILPIILLYTTYVFYFFNIMEETAEQAIMSSSFVVQGALLGFMILGYYLIRREKDNQCDELFFSMPYGETYKIIGKSLVSFFLITSFVLMNSIILFIFYSVTNAPKELYIDSILYFILYWELGFIIAGLIGMIIGVFIKSRSAYITMFIIWLFIGPLNYYMFKILSTLTNIDLRVVQYILNLGQHDIHAPYKPIYGFPLQNFNFTQRLLILFTLLAFFIVLYWRKSKKIVITTLVIFFIVFIPTFNNYKLNFEVIKLYVSYSHDEKYDLMYYFEHQDDEIIKSEIEFKIKTCDIDLNVDNEIKMNTKLKVQLEEASDRIVFSLYRNFKINSVKDEKGEVLKFNRKGDSVEVVFNEKVDRQQEKIITFNYEGYSSPLFFADKNAVMLPAYFPYIPSNINAPAMACTTYGDFYRNDCSYTADYTLTYKGKHKMYTNLDKVGENKWQGNNVKGVTLVSGSVKEKTSDGITFYYPSVAKNGDNYYKNQIDIYKTAIEKVNKDFGERLNTNVKKVFFIPIPGEDPLGFTLWNHDNNFIFQTNSCETKTYFDENKNSELLEVLSLSLRKNDMTEDYFRIKELFFNICRYEYNRVNEEWVLENIDCELDIYKNELESLKSDPELVDKVSICEKKIKIYEKIINIFKEDSDKLDNFSANIYKKIKNQDMTFEEFLDLVIKEI